MSQVLKCRASYLCFTTRSCNEWDNQLGGMQLQLLSYFECVLKRAHIAVLRRFMHLISDILSLDDIQVFWNVNDQSLHASFEG